MWILANWWIGTAHALTLTVPGTSPTIAGAVALASNGDTIEVAAGVWDETIQVNGKSITIMGTGTPTAFGLTGTVLTTSDSSADAAFRVFGGSNVTFKSVTFTSTVSDTRCLWLDGSTVTLSGVVMHDCQDVDEGGAFYVGPTGDLLSSGGFFSYDLTTPAVSGSNGQGGFGYVLGTFDSFGDDFDGGSADRGGALYVDGIASIDAATFDDNSADQFGGAIYVGSGGGLLVENSNLFDSSAGIRGGAIYAVQSDIELYDSDVGSGDAPDGAGLALVSSASVIAEGVDFFLNDAGSGFGGAVYLEASSGIDRFTDCSFDDNTASSIGGALFIQPSGGLVTLDQTGFYFNDAGGFGGAIGSQFGPADISVTGGYFEANTAGSGGAIDYSSTGLLLIDTTEFDGNGAVNNGGTVYTSGANGEVWLVDSVVTGSTAVQGAVADMTGDLEMLRVSLGFNGDSNTKTIVRSSGPMALVNVDVASNSASEELVRHTGSSDALVEYVSFRDNLASTVLALLGAGSNTVRSVLWTGNTGTAVGIPSASNLLGQSLVVHDHAGALVDGAGAATLSVLTDDPLYVTSDVDGENNTIEQGSWLSPASPYRDLGPLFDVDGSLAMVGAFGGANAAGWGPWGYDGDEDGAFYGGDCADNDEGVFPGQTQTVGLGFDINCDGQILCYADVDGDGFGDASTIQPVDEAPGGCDDPSLDNASVAGDCNDNDPLISGGTLVFVDVDGDGFGDDAIGQTDSCNLPAGAAAVGQGGDCDDTNNLIGPHITEVVGNAVDEDCDGTNTCYFDSDGDGFGQEGVTLTSGTVQACTYANAASVAGDCAPNDAASFPGAPELPADGVDQSCDGNESCYVDGDDDGYGVLGVVADVVLTEDGCDVPGFASQIGDCSPTNGNIFPMAEETPADGFDSDCDGVDLCFVDGDGDGVGTLETAPSGVTLNCTVPGLSVLSNDCDDENVLVNPGQAEQPGDGLDSNCDGVESCFADGDGDGFGVVPASGILPFVLFDVIETALRWRRRGGRRIGL